jgi:hypothetical protein
VATQDTTPTSPTFAENERLRALLVERQGIDAGTAARARDIQEVINSVPTRGFGQRFLMAMSDPRLPAAVRQRDVNEALLPLQLGSEIGLTAAQTSTEELRAQTLSEKLAILQDPLAYIKRIFGLGEDEDDKAKELQKGVDAMQSVSDRQKAASYDITKSLQEAADEYENITGTSFSAKDIRQMATQLEESGLGTLPSGARDSAITHAVLSAGQSRFFQPGGLSDDALTALGVPSAEAISRMTPDVVAELRRLGISEEQIAAAAAQEAARASALRQRRGTERQSFLSQGPQLRQELEGFLDTVRNAASFGGTTRGAARFLPQATTRDMISRAIQTGEAAAELQQAGFGGVPFSPSINGVSIPVYQPAIEKQRPQRLSVDDAARFRASQPFVPAIP